MNQVLTNVGLLLLRWMTGIIFIVHGTQKFMDMAGTGGFFQSIGLPVALTPVVAGVELVGGILLVLGLATRFAGAALTAVMIGAIMTTKLGQGYMDMEFDFLVLFAAVQPIFTGAGAFSLDSVIFRKRARSGNAQIV